MKTFLSYIYTVICTLSPVLVIYSFVGGPFTFLDTFILLFYIISIPSYLTKRKKVVMPFVLLFLFVFIHSIFVYLDNNDLSIFLRAMHLANFIFFLAFYHKIYFNDKLAIRIVSNFSVIATLFLIVQHLCFRFLGFPIPGIIPQYAIIEANLDNIIQNSNIYRYSSFFVEPAAFAQYIMCALTCLLFYDGNKNYKYIGLICIGCILSTSNTAIASMVLILVLYFVKSGISFKKIFSYLLAGIAIIIMTKPFIEALIVRNEGGVSYDNRFDGYQLVNQLLSNSIWGNGFIAPDDMGIYLPGFARLFVYLGIVGVCIYFLIFLYLFRNTSRKVLLFLFLFLNLGSDTLMGVGFLYYCCFILAALNKNVRKQV